MNKSKNGNVMVRLSVVLTNYNYAAFVGRVIESIVIIRDRENILWQHYR